MNERSTRAQAVALLRSGMRNADVARTLNVPVGTVGWWKHQDLAKLGRLPGRHAPSCFRCREHQPDGPSYVYLLGLYLGDGHIVQPKQHRVPNLTIACSDDWPGLMDRAESAIRSVLPTNSVCRVRARGCTNIKVYSKHLPCILPQHGPGRKHERDVSLEPWQRQLVRAHPWPLVQGLIHSDGCRVTNRITRTVGGEKRRYEYPRYFFTNKSTDIVRLFAATLDAVGVDWKSTLDRNGAVNVSVARRESVALMDKHVGPKH